MREEAQQLRLAASADSDANSKIKKEILAYADDMDDWAVSESNEGSDAFETRNNDATTLETDCRNFLANDSK